MAEGVMEMKERLSQEDYVSVDARIQYFLDRFYMSRIGLRMIIHQHCELASHENVTCYRYYLSNDLELTRYSNDIEHDIVHL